MGSSLLALSISCKNQTTPRKRLKINCFANAAATFYGFELFQRGRNNILVATVKICQSSFFTGYAFSPPLSLSLSLSQWLPPFKISSGHIFHTLKLLPIKILNVCVYVLWRTRVREKRNEENVRLRMVKNTKR